MDYAAKAIRTFERRINALRMWENGEITWGEFRSKIKASGYHPDKLESKKNYQGDRDSRGIFQAFADSATHLCYTDESYDELMKVYNNLIKK